MVWSPADSIASTLEGYYQYLPAHCSTVILMIRRTARWWKPSTTLRIYPNTTQLLILYKITGCATALYISPRDCTVAPVHSRTIATYHRWRIFHTYYRQLPAIKTIGRQSTKTYRNIGGGG